MRFLKFINLERVKINMKKVKLFLLLLAVVAMLVPFVLPSSVVYADEDIIFGETFYVEASVEWLLDLLIEGGHFESALEEFGSLDALLLALADVEFVEVRGGYDGTEFDLQLSNESELHLLEQMNVMSEAEFLDYLHHFVFENCMDLDNSDFIDFVPFSHMSPSGVICSGRISSRSTTLDSESFQHYFTFTFLGEVNRVWCTVTIAMVETNLSCDTCSWTAKDISLQRRHSISSCPDR